MRIKQEQFHREQGERQSQRERPYGEQDELEDLDEIRIVTPNTR